MYSYIPQGVKLCKNGIKSCFFVTFAPCTLRGVWWRFGGTGWLFLQGWRRGPASKGVNFKSSCCLSPSMLGILFWPEDGGSTFQRSVGKILPQLHGQDDNMCSSLYLTSYFILIPFINCTYYIDLNDEVGRVWRQTAVAYFKVIL